jgi:protein-S-isoprenylcysteine O-methyltransferase Ste14
MAMQSKNRAGLKDWVRRLLNTGVMIGVPFISYGSIYWREAWLFVAISIIGKMRLGYYLKLKDPELLKRRMAVQPGTKGWDKVWLAFYVPAFMAIMVVAGIDAGRFHWSWVPFWAVVLGAVGYVAFMLFTFWAMMNNTHFEGTVRIQTDRDHKVMDGGPYRLVRHPGYVSIMGMMLSIPLLLGSLVAFIPSILMALLLIIRTVLEDRTLKKELSGYNEYAAQVRYRLVPGVW